MKARLVVFIILLPLLILAVLPWFWWASVKPARELTVAVVDKTVPKQDYREHLGLFWVLTHEKITKRSDRLYQAEDDYTGFRPKASKEDPYLVFPDQKADLIYIADTYGVYKKDFSDNVRGERSQLIYGGLTFYDWNRILDARAGNVPTIMEFNSIASPTDHYVRSLVEQSMGFQWTGWIGRYFANLDSPEVPVWLIENYQDQYNEAWAFTGEGIAFVDERDQVVILADSEISGPVHFNFTKAGLNHFKHANDSTYQYWFDVIVPSDAYQIEAIYDLVLNEDAMKKLEQVGIPTTFPAVIYDPERNFYYFAGDYADIKLNYQAKWTLPKVFYQVFSFFYPDDTFFWNSYIPMMKTILAEIAKDTQQ